MEILNSAKRKLTHNGWLQKQLEPDNTGDLNPTIEYFNELIDRTIAVLGSLHVHVLMTKLLLTIAAAILE